MTIPGQNLSVNDPGLGLVETNASTPLVLGTAELGTNYEKLSHSNKNDVVAAYGQGPLAEAVCHMLDIAGGPVQSMKVDGTVASTIGAVTPILVSTATGTITTGGTALDAYEAIVEILTTGSVAAADFQFRFSLDDGRTFSEPIAVPAAGTYAIPNSGVTITFVDGAGPIFFEAGDLHEFDTTEPYYSVTELALAVTALLAASLDWGYLVVTGTPASAADGATFFAALATHLTTFFNNFHYVRAIMSASDDTEANVITSFAAVEDERISAVYSTADTTSGKPNAGYGTPKMSALVTVAARAAAVLISTDLARVASGSLTGVIEIGHDESQSETLDSQRITTLRTWPGRAGFYITNARLKSAAGSDFRYWQHGRIMDLACATTFQFQQLFISAAVRVNGGAAGANPVPGSIDERDAQRYETVGDRALSGKLKQPDNAEGSRGHVSDLAYTIDRDNDVLTTEAILSEVAIRPLAYPKTITTQLGFTANVGG